MTSFPLNDAAGAQRPRPIAQDGVSYELLDIQGKPIGRFPDREHCLSLITTWPRRTLFLVRRWAIAGGQMAVDKRWLICYGLDGKFRQTEVNRHWTTSDTPGR